MFVVGFISGALTLFVLFVIRGIRADSQRSKAMAFSAHYSPCALIYARTDFDTIAERKDNEPVAAKLAVHAQKRISEILGETA